MHAPQFVGSDARLTHLLPHRSGEGAAQLDEHAGVPAAVEHRPVGAVQLLLHWPQFAAVVSDVSHPSSVRVEQCP